MYNVGRNNPRARAALIEALELETPGKVQLGVSPLPGLLAAALLERAPSSLGRVLFTSSGAEAVEAALKLGRAATGRSKVVSCEHGFHGLTLGGRRRCVQQPLRSPPAGFFPRALRRSRGTRGGAAGRGRRRLHRRARSGARAVLPVGWLPEGRSRALSPLRDALLRRRGADRI